MEGSKYSAPNLERGLHVVEMLLHESGGLTQSEIAERLGCTRSTVFRICTTLLEHGYLKRNADGSHLQLSRKFQALGSRGLADRARMQQAMDVMRQIRDEFKETVLLGTLFDDEILVMNQILGLHPFKFAVDPGTRVPIHCSAPGKAILAFVSSAELEKVLGRIEFQRYNTNTITTASALKKELSQVHELGYALDRGEQLKDVRCIGVPIMDDRDLVMASIWLTGPADRLVGYDIDSIGRRLVELASALSGAKRM